MIEVSPDVVIRGMRMRLDQVIHRWREAIRERTEVELLLGERMREGWGGDVGNGPAAGRYRIGGGLEDRPGGKAPTSLAVAVPPRRGRRGGARAARGMRTTVGGGAGMLFPHVPRGSFRGLSPARDPVRMNENEARGLLEILDTVIDDYQREIAEVNRMIRRVRQDRKAQLGRLKVLLEGLLPTEGTDLEYFDAHGFVRKHRSLFQTAATCAGACGEVFPNWDKDFKALPKLQRQKLFARLSA